MKQKAQKLKGVAAAINSYPIAQGQLKTDSVQSGMTYSHSIQGPHKSCILLRSLSRCHFKLECMSPQDRKLVGRNHYA